MKYLPIHAGINIITAFFLFTITVFAQTKNNEKNPPNILIITVDNIGYGDLPMYNKDSPIITPNLEQLAADGAKLTSFYTAGATCTVSRASLLTGRIPRRHQLVNQLGGISGNYGVGLRQSEVIIPRMLESSPHQYATGAFGKWNIGFAPGSRPTDRGFDEYLGIASGNADHFTHVYAGKKDLYHNTESINRTGEYSTDLFANAAIDFIEKNTDQSIPWFVYLPFDAPHHPGDRNIDPDAENIWQAPDYAFEPYGLSPREEDPQKRFNAVVTAVDMAIGRVMKKLEELGVAENTFIFFYSDNGAFYPYIESGIQSNAPLKGAGVTLWEGGIRIPALARWPGKIREGSVIDTRLWSLDLFPTCAKLANAKMPEDRFIDGKNLLPNLTGETIHSPHSTLFFEYRNFSALHWGDWKILREGDDEDWQLYNLNEDLSESNNIAADNEEKVIKLSAAFEQKKDEINNYLKIEHMFQKEN
ncbi:sulfatase-like hydrolase/transferase [Membranihabitans maritimus]|uniref:sulfatase-like hydrolase/transferase n=1 Tax=Membranihabitans maritimus TaxID=2904244 RepID=UPI001F02A05D|nr:sulfatase-like hydrolase/transferase [Membranihabitans maritimus]